MPQPPNLQNMLRQAQEMMAAQQEAQEALKSERVEASAGGGMVKVVMTGDLHLESIADRPRRGRPRGRRDAPGHGRGGGQRGAALGPGAAGVQARRPGGGEGFDPMSALDALGMGGMGGALGGGGGGGGLPGGAAQPRRRRRKKR